MRAPDVQRMPEVSLVREWVRIGRQAHNSPKLTGKALVDAISVQEVWPGSLAIWHLNQAGFAIKAGGVVAYFDPYLSDELERLTKDRLDEHSRLFRSPLEGSDITNADFIFCSHDHLDHIDPPGNPRDRNSVTAGHVCDSSGRKEKTVESRHRRESISDFSRG